MQTGDIILFSDVHFIPSRIIEFCSQSKYSHVGLIVKNCLGLEYDKTFILESTGFSDIPDAKDGKIKWGVQIRDFEKVKEEYNGDIYHREIICNRDETFYKKIQEAYNIVHDKSYNTSPIEWFSLLVDKDFCDNIENSFVCSTLAAFVLKQLGIIEHKDDTNLTRPKDLGTEYQEKDRRIKFINCVINDEIQIK